MYVVSIRRDETWDTAPHVWGPFTTLAAAERHALVQIEADQDWRPVSTVQIDRITGS